MSQLLTENSTGVALSRSAVCPRGNHQPASDRPQSALRQLAAAAFAMLSQIVESFAPRRRHHEPNAPLTRVRRPRKLCTDESPFRSRRDLGSARSRSRARRGGRGVTYRLATARRPV